jgi:hypothetical protein
MRYDISPVDRYAKFLPWAWPSALLIWCLLLCFVPDPRPLSAPGLFVDATRAVLKISEPASRAVSTVALRAIGLAAIGILLAFCLKQVPIKIAVPVVLIASPAIAILCQCINYGYFPIFLQLQLGIASALIGAMIGLAICRSWIAGCILSVLLIGLYFWGTATGISDDLTENSRATGEYLLANADQIPSGDEGFMKLVELAFLYAEDNSHSTDAVHANRAAILALGVILGQERIASVAKRPIDLERIDELTRLRNRITLMGRNDLARHFWVSAALVVLSDSNRAAVVGLGKEMKDATEGGSGFSFVDLMADQAGTMLAIAATKSAANARRIHSLVQQGVVVDDLFPSIEGLPEGISGDTFQSEYGGLGGSKTRGLLSEMERRLQTCAALLPLK